MPLRMPGIRLSRRFVKILLSVVLAVLVLLGLAAWQVPKVLRTVLTEDVSELIGRPIGVGDIRFNPFTLRLRARELSVAQPGAAPLFEAVELDVNASWASLFRLAPVVDAITVRQPKLTLVREDVARFNFSDIVQRLADMAAAKPPEPEADTGLPRFSLNNLRLEGGVVTLDDRVTGRRQVIDELTIGVPFVSTFAYATDIDVLPRLHLRINGSPFDMDGTARPFEATRPSTLNVVFSGLDLEKWADVWPVPLPVRVHSALLDSNLKILFEQPQDAPPRIQVQGDLGLRRLDVRETGGQPLLAWDALAIERVSLDPIARTLAVGAVRLSGPQASVHRDAQQQLNWLRVIDRLAAGASAPDKAGARPAAKAGQGAAAVPAPAVQASAPAQGQAEAQAPAPGPGPAQAPGGAAPPAGGATGAATDAAAQAPARPAADPAATAPAPAGPAAAPAWKVSVDAVNIDDAAVHVRDDPSGLDYPVRGLSVTAENIALPQPAGQPVQLWASMDDPDGGGWLRVKSPLTLQPLALDADVQLGELALARFAPLVRHYAPISIENGRLGLQARVRVAGTQAEALDVKADLAGLAVRDEGVKPAVALSLDSLALTADRLAADSRPAAFTLQAGGIQGKGRLALQGTLVPQPLSLKTSVDLADLDVASFAPYAASSLNATVRSVALAARGQAEFAAASGTAPLRAAWRGAVDVNDLDLEDRVNRADFLNWKHLGFSGMDISVAGDRLGLNLGDIALENFYGNVLLNAQGRLNVLDLVAEPGQAGGSITQDTQARARETPARKSAGPAPDITIGKVTLKGGRMTFNDRFVRPNYTAELSSVEGSVSGVSSSKPAPARVSVGGRVYRSAPFSVAGTVQPFEKFLSLDLKASAKGVDLPRFTTYSAKYVGYPIQRGKLSLDLHYQIKDRALQASNRVVLNQLTFGNKTDSPDAIQLPVLLAVALLKDSRGNIDIDLPISGSLDDPQFSVGGIILRVVMNLLVKAVTSPFQLLASAFGGGEELSYIEFPAGSAQLDDQAKSSIETLAKALNDRPSLKLDVVGRADPQADEAALREAWLDERIRMAKARDTAGRGQKPDPAAVQVSAQERAEYLEDVYDDTDLKDKPRNFIGMAKSVPADQMEAMLLKAAPVGRQALQRLAEARAQAVYEQLQAQGPADRIFVVAPKLDAEGIQDDGKATRVDFSLQ